MNTRPSKRPSVKDVSKWYQEYENTMEDWKGNSIWVMVEQGYPFPDFYRVSYTINGAKKSKLFYGESAWMNVNRLVRDIGFYNFLGV